MGGEALRDDTTNGSVADHPVHGTAQLLKVVPEGRLDFRRLPGPVSDPPRRETLSGDECGLIFPNSGW